MSSNQSQSGLWAMYLFHAELTSLQGLTEAHLPMEEAALVDQCGGLSEALTHRDALRQVGMETDWDVVSNKKREVYSSLL